MGSVNANMKDYLQPIALILAIILGVVANTTLFVLNDIFLDMAIYLVLIAVFFFFFFIKLKDALQDTQYLTVAWVTNFIIIPIIAFVIVSLFTEVGSLLFLGLIIYLIAPCTDWVLGFTKLAKGDVERNTILLPINLITQLLLVTLVITFFSETVMVVPVADLVETLLWWILIPFILAQILLFISFKIKKKYFQKIQETANHSIIYVTILLVFIIFFVNAHLLIEQLTLLPQIIIVIMAFFIITYYLVRFIARKLSFNHAKESALSITTAARNAPFMLGITLLLLPEASIVHLVLIVGMLVEFPHLITLTYLLKKQK